jgi:UDP-N-acetylmuramate--alanine ligase
MTAYFFVGIGGSGMLPLAEIVRAQGAEVAGSDRALDQGRTTPKFDALAAQGIGLHAQDGRGVVSPDQIVVASAAIEATVPDIVRATELGCPRMTRAELLAELFNAAPLSIAVGGTSGKSTVTGMIGHILATAGRDPTIMNGARMKDFGGASARVGNGDLFVSEVDESDGSIALFKPSIAVLNNLAVDHKSLDELRTLFGDFARTARRCAVNADNAEALAVAPEGAFTFGTSRTAMLRATAIEERADGVDFTATHGDMVVEVSLRVPGRHNVSNALAALAGTALAGLRLKDAAEAIAGFTGLDRRLDVLGTANGVTVIDDFGHNPDKVAATLQTLRAFPGRLLVFFQPHGYGPLKLMAPELARSFAASLAPEDRLIVSDPAYFGGTTDRSVGSDALTSRVPNAEHIASRGACAARLLDLATPGDRIIVMGARDDTLTDFAKQLLETLSRSPPSVVEG